MNTLNIIKKEGYAIIQLKRGKVNALNYEMVGEIRTTIQNLESDDEIKGAILTGTPHFFSAGLDVIELYDYERPKMHDFFIAFGAMHVELAKFTKPLICAITGHSPAGGTVIAITADYRVMADHPKYGIGLNEVAVSVQISQNLVDGYAFWVGEGKASEFILDGKLLNPQEAKEAGLVSEICPLEEVLERAENKMRQYLKADPDIFKNSKAKLRRRWWDKLDSNGDSDLKMAEAVWWKPEVRIRMKGLIDSLTKRK